jgi:hypothetical protein
MQFIHFSILFYFIRRRRRRTLFLLCAVIWVRSAAAGHVCTTFFFPIYITWRCCCCCCSLNIIKSCGPSIYAKCKIILKLIFLNFFSLEFIQFFCTAHHRKCLTYHDVNKIDLNRLYRTLMKRARGNLN